MYYTIMRKCEFFTGTVTFKRLAVFAASGIGGQYGTNSGSVTINGGTVSAESNGYYSSAKSKDVGGAGIGGGPMADCGDVTITGGIVTAAGYYGGGSKESGAGDGGTVTITGGTVTATAYGKSLYDEYGGGTVKYSGAGIGHGSVVKAGYDGSNGADGSCYITGGSVYVYSDGDDKIKMGPTPKTKSGGTEIYQTIVTLEGVFGKTAITSLTVTCSYGTDSIYTNSSGKLYLWLPNGTKVTEAETTKVYSGSITTENSGKTTTGTLHSALSTSTTVSVSNKDTSKSTNTYGDTLKMKAIVKGDDGAVKPDKSEVEFFCGDTFLGEATTVDSSGYATLEYDTAEKKIPCGSKQSIKAVYTPGTSHDGQYKTSSGTASVSIGKKALTASVKSGQSKWMLIPVSAENSPIFSIFHIFCFCII